MAAKVDTGALLRAFLVAAVALGFYATIAHAGGEATDLPGSFFLSPDSQQYRAVSDWLYGISSDPAGSDHRPILYPLLLGLRWIGGVRLVWLVQVALWLAAVLLVHGAVRRRTGSYGWAYVGAFFFATHVSPILITYHGLTETLVLFLLACFVALAARGPGLFTRPTMIAGGTFLLSLLTITKPVYKLHLGLYLLVVLWIAWRERTRLAAKAVAVAVALAPVAGQAAIMLGVHGFFGISTKQNDSFRNYFVARLYEQGSGCDLDEAQRVVASFDEPRVRAFLRERPAAAARLFVHNLVDENLLAGSVFVQRHGTWRLFEWSRRYDRGLAVCLLLFVPLLLLVRARRWAWDLVVCFGFGLLLVVTSGIVFWGGDRLVVVALPLWIYAYATLAQWSAARLVALWRERVGPRLLRR